MSAPITPRLFTLARVARWNIFPSIVVMRMDGGDPTSFCGVVADGDGIHLNALVLVGLVTPYKFA
jgi:hypothetical protein